METRPDSGLVRLLSFQQVHEYRGGVDRAGVPFFESREKIPQSSGKQEVLPALPRIQIHLPASFHGV